MFWAEIEDCNEEIAHFSVVRKHMEKIVSSVLQLDKNHGINRKFSELGLDSIMMIEIKNHTSTLLGEKVQIKINDFSDNEDLDSLVKYIFILIKLESTPKEADQKKGVNNPLE